MLKHTITCICVAFSLIFSPWSFADESNSYTVNIPNNQGGYTAVVLQQSGSGYIGPQGEYYSTFPSVYQLQVMYANGVSNPAPVVDTIDDSEDQTISVPAAPPDIPDYVQPDPPGPGYIWTPGYWVYDSSIEDYYWVPGTWVKPPRPGLLWTPGYWYWHNGFYVFHDGYWGDHIGFYGGVDYGHGYGGHGFTGGYWRNNTFVSIHVTTGIKNHSSFNGGPGGVEAKPTLQEQSVTHEHHWQPTVQQRSQVQAAMHNQGLRASVNHGSPSIAATIKPGVFQGAEVGKTIKAGGYYKESKPIAAIKPSAIRHQSERTEFTNNQVIPQSTVHPTPVHPQSNSVVNKNKNPKPQSKPKPKSKPPQSQPDPNKPKGWSDQ